jgi:hypothetical protein
LRLVRNLNSCAPLQTISFPVVCHYNAACPAGGPPGVGPSKERLMPSTNLYETDFIAWTERQATLLRTPVTERGSLVLDWKTWPKRSKASASHIAGRWPTTSARLSSIC